MGGVDPVAGITMSNEPRLPTSPVADSDWPARAPTGRRDPPGRRLGLPYKIPSPHQPPRTRPTAASPDPGFPECLFEGPRSVLVYGASRALVNLALFGLAEATSPCFQWVDIGVPGEVRPELDPVSLGWVPQDRLGRSATPRTFVRTT